MSENVASPFWKNRLIFSDNLAALSNPTYIKPESVDLVYLDPPFNSGRDYNALFKEASGVRAMAQVEAFEDTWHWDKAAAESFRLTQHLDERLSRVMQGFEMQLGHNDMLAYLSMMAPRLWAMKAAMKPTASIYLHCDPTASHYLKVLMDAVFGSDNFRSEIVWKRHVMAGSGKTGLSKWGSKTDTILFYTMTDDYYFHPPCREVTDEAIAAKFCHTEPETGRSFETQPLILPGSEPKSLIFPDRGQFCAPKGKRFAWNQETLDERLKHNPNVIYWTSGGAPRHKKYSDGFEGAPITNLWDDILPLTSTMSERLGYPTQKPEALLDRIICASSRPGDTILDPFCGCGTALAVAQKLDRKWIGIDITHVAMGIIKNRLEKQYGPDIHKTYEVFGIPKTIAEARALIAEEGGRFKFQDWALTFLTGARPNAQGAKKGADRGRDGTKILDLPGGKSLRILIQVKSGGLKRGDVATLVGDMHNQHYDFGLLVTMEDSTGPMRKEAVDAGYWEPPAGSLGGFMKDCYPRVQIMTVAELMDGKKPDFPDYHEGTFSDAPK